MVKGCTACIETVDGYTTGKKLLNSWYAAACRRCKNVFVPSSLRHGVYKKEDCYLLYLLYFIQIFFLIDSFSKKMIGTKKFLVLGSIFLKLGVEKKRTGRFHLVVGQHIGRKREISKGTTSTIMTLNSS